MSSRGKAIFTIRWGPAAVWLLTAELADLPHREDLETGRSSRTRRFLTTSPTDTRYATAWRARRCAHRGSVRRVACRTRSPMSRSLTGSSRRSALIHWNCLYSLQFVLLSLSMAPCQVPTAGIDEPPEGRRGQIARSGPRSSARELGRRKPRRVATLRGERGRGKAWLTRPASRGSPGFGNGGPSRKDRRPPFTAEPQPSSGPQAAAS